MPQVYQELYIYQNKSTTHFHRFTELWTHNTWEIQLQETSWTLSLIHTNTVSILSLNTTSAHPPITHRPITDPPSHTDTMNFIPHSHHHHLHPVIQHHHCSSTSHPPSHHTNTKVPIASHTPTQALSITISHLPRTFRSPDGHAALLASMYKVHHEGCVNDRCKGSRVGSGDLQWQSEWWDEWYQLTDIDFW